MKKKTNFPIGSIAMFLCCVLFVTSIILFTKTNENSSGYTAQVRTVELTVMPEYDSYLEDFTEKSITTNDSQVSFYGKMEFNEDVLTVFDKISLAEDVDQEESNIVYDCSFDMDNMQFIFKATLLDEYNNPLEIEEIVTDAFVTETGRLDAYLELDGDTYLISDFISTDAIDECLFGWLKPIVVVVVVIVVYVVVAETAEQIKVKSNYDYNKKLEQQGNGVKYGNFITRQNETNLKDYNCGNYRFGFTTFSGVGCEVASVYNAMIALGKTEMLSETIYSFEKWAIEFAIAWGKFGSNPLQISTYLNKKGIGYSKITNYNNFKSQVEKQANCHIIMSRWNNSWTDGLHTFYIKKQNSKYYSYNWVYSYATVDRNNIDAFNDGSGFIVGYILWKK